MPVQGKAGAEHGAGSKAGSGIAKPGERGHVARPGKEMRVVKGGGVTDVEPVRTQAVPADFGDEVLKRFKLISRVRALRYLG